MHHVIKSGDSLKKLSRTYNAVESEIIESNPHISDFENLQPGMKINIPINNANTKSEIGYVKPFIENYYKNNEHTNNVSDSIEENTEKLDKNTQSVQIDNNSPEKKEKIDKTYNNNSGRVFVDYSNIYYDSRTNKYYYKVRPR